MKYKITVKNGFINKLITELNHWHVKPCKYEVSGDSILTASSNVVDVATETFREAMHLLEIVRVKKQENKS